MLMLNSEQIHIFVFVKSFCHFHVHFCWNKENFTVFFRIIITTKEWFKVNGSEKKIGRNEGKKVLELYRRSIVILQF